jgi:hypothetical protein
VSDPIDDLKLCPWGAFQMYTGLFGVLHRFYRGEAVPMMELTWPDRDGKYPWDDGVGARCREWQPRLWLPLNSRDVDPWRGITEGA